MPSAPEPLNEAKLKVAVIVALALAKAVVLTAYVASLPALLVSCSHPDPAESPRPLAVSCGVYHVPPTVQPESRVVPVKLPVRVVVWERAAGRKARAAAIANAATAVERTLTGVSARLLFKVTIIVA